MEKITKREMYESIIVWATTGEMKYDGDVYIDFCQKEIDARDKKSAKAKETAARKRAESDALMDAVYEAMSTEEFEPIAEIAGRIEGEDVTVAKVTYRLGQLFKAGKAEKQEIEVSGGESQKKRKAMGYRKIVSE